MLSSVLRRVVVIFLDVFVVTKSCKALVHTYTSTVGSCLNSLIFMTNSDNADIKT